MSAPIPIRKPQRGIPKGRPHLRGMDRGALKTWAREHLEGPAYRGQQLFEWVHGHRARDFDAMTNLGQADRQRLAAVARLDALQVDAVQHAADGTRKLRLRTTDGEAIETVLIPNPGRGLTQCISSMVGCSLSCRFCATASLGFCRNLDTWEIVDQVYRAQDLLVTEAEATHAEHPDRITNVVFMGMGEPLHNFGHVRQSIEILTDAEGANIAGRRITVSTAGMVPAIERFVRDGLASRVGLAVSLNATTDAVRDEIMPINRRWNLEALLRAVRAIPAPRRRLITFEYVLLADINDTDNDADRLGVLLAGLRAQVNVIPFNPHPHAPYRRPSAARVDAFVARCRAAGLPVYLRTPRGDDIAAACGQLAAQD